jgi:hypothetical protein
LLVLDELESVVEPSELLELFDEVLSVPDCALVSVVAVLAKPVPHAIPPARIPIVAIPETNADVVLIVVCPFRYQANFSA